ncbi:MAG: hypothetical protein ACREM2_02035 [Vulcanimicrobiaceae bacterium]
MPAVLAVAIAAALVHPREAARAAPRTVFTGPSGWTRVDSLTQGGLDWNYYPPGAGGKGPHIVIEAHPVSATMQLSDLVRLSRLGLVRLSGRAGIKADHSETICAGSKQGWFFESIFGMTESSAFDTEQVIGRGANLGYIATYARPKGAPENQAARAALASLCPV